MGHYAFKMRLKPGAKQEYLQRHSQIWPELVDLIRNAGVSEYHIYYDEDYNQVYAFQQHDGVDSQSLGSNPIVQKWWAYMADLMETNSDNSPISTPLEKVFTL
jgi:L-rhamnose mutarotase